MGDDAMADVSQHTTAEMLDEALAAARDAMTAAMDDEPDDEDMGDDDTMEDDEDEDPEFYDSEEDNYDEDQFGDVRILLALVGAGPENCSDMSKWSLGLTLDPLSTSLPQLSMDRTDQYLSVGPEVATPSREMDSLLRAMMHHRQDVGSPRMRELSWDENVVLKRQFSALVPAFDPRPGRRNEPATTDLAVPPPGSPHESLTPHDHIVRPPSGPRQIALYLLDQSASEEERQRPRPENLHRLPADSTIFRAIQRHCKDVNQLEKTWEPTYTLVYRSEAVSVPVVPKVRQMWAE